MSEKDLSISHPQIGSLYNLYLTEMQAFRKVHRMIDLFESIIKMHTVVIVSEYVAYNNLSDVAKGLLAQGLRTPSLGTWQLFSRVLFTELQLASYQWMLDELPLDFVLSDNELSSGLLNAKLEFPQFNKEVLIQLKADKKNRQSNFDDVIALRNSYAHGATPSDEKCAEDIQKFEPFLTQLLVLNWLHHSYLEVEDNKVMLNYKQQKLSLHPLLLYRNEQTQASFAFFNDLKNDKIGLLNYPLGKHYREKEFLNEFHQYIPINEWKKTGANEFQQRIEELTETFKGRTAERKQLLNFVVEKQKGYCSIQGNPGIGKSALIAQFFKDLRLHDSCKDIQVIEYFIRRGTQQAKPEVLLEYLIKKTDELFPKAREIRAEGKMVFDLQNQLFTKWRLWAEHCKGTKILFLIDGLDEGVEENIIQYLPKENFQNILFIYGSRPGGHKSIDELWGNLPIEHHLKIELSGLGKEDIRAMIYEVANKYEIEKDSAWIEAIQQRSQGNPLYLKLLCDAIANKSIGLNDINALPKEIDEYYKAILFRYAQDSVDGDALLDSLYTFAAAKDYLSFAHIGLINKLGEAKLQRIGSTLKEVLIENPLTENVLDYQIFHESFREYLFKEKSFKITEANEQIINYCASWKELEGTWEQRYALEFYAVHLCESQKAIHHETLLKLIEDKAYLIAQKKVLRHFKASNKLMQLAIEKSAELKNQDTLLEAALCLVDLKYEEDNDAPRILEIIANGEIDFALQRIEAFGTNDKEGLERKFILYMLCLMELTLLESKDKPFRKAAIEKLLKHLDENIPIDHSVLNWNDFFSSYLVFQMACEWAELGLDYKIIYKKTKWFGIQWLTEKETISIDQINLLLDCSTLIDEGSELRKHLITIALKLVDIGEFNRSINLFQKGIEMSPELDDDLWESVLLSKISTKEFLIGNISEAEKKIVNAMEIAEEIILMSEKVESFSKISTELFKQQKIDDSIALLNKAIGLTKEITDSEEKCKSLIKIFKELNKQGLIEEAKTFYEKAYKLSEEIEEGIYQWQSTIQSQIFIEIAKYIETEKLLIGIQSIKSEPLKITSLISISSILYEREKTDLADSVINDIVKFIQNKSDGFLKKVLTSKLLTKFAKQNKYNDAVSLLFECLRLQTLNFDELLKNQKLFEISQGFEQNNSEYKSDLIFKEILNNSEKLEDAGPLCKVAKNLFLSNKHEEALTIIEKALFNARSTDETYIKCIEILEISTELFNQGNLEFSSILINEAIQLSNQAEVWHEGPIKFEICLELLKQNKINESFDFTKQIISKEYKISSLTTIAADFASKNMKLEADALMLEAFSLIKDINQIHVAKVLCDLSINLYKQGKSEMAFKYIKDIDDDYYKCSALHDITIELAYNGQWQQAEKTGLEIHQIDTRQECWKTIANKTKEQLGWKKALEQLSKLQNEETYDYYLKGLAENINVNDANKECLFEFLPLIMNDSNSIETVLQAYALNEIFFNKPSNELIERLNSSLNIQWALNIAAKFEKEFERASHNVQEWINEIADENDREDVLSWAEKVEQGKMTEEKFLERVNKL